MMPDSVMPGILELFSSEWDEDTKEDICRALVSILNKGGVVLGAYISDEDDPGDSEDDFDMAGDIAGDFVSVGIEEEEPEEKPYDWYIEDEEDEPEYRPVVGICAICAELFNLSAAEHISGVNEYAGMPLLCVAPGYRRLGIGKGLFRRAARLARSLDARRLYIPSSSDEGAIAFFGAVGCSVTRPAPDSAPDCVPDCAPDCAPDCVPDCAPWSRPLAYGQTGITPFEYQLFPKSAGGTDIITIEEYQTMAGTILDSLPKEFFNQLNGGVVVRPEKKTHSKSVPGAPMYIMGEYTRSSMMGRMIYLYYGSFVIIYGRLPRPEQRDILRGIIVHEFRHHMEWLSGTRELEEEDERGLKAYLARFAGKKDKRGRKKKHDTD